MAVKMRVNGGEWVDVGGKSASILTGGIVVNEDTPRTYNAGVNFTPDDVPAIDLFFYIKRSTVKYLQRYRRRGERMKK